MSDPTQGPAGPHRAPPALTAGGRLALTLAISEYDHVKDLVTREIRPEGIDLVPISLPVEEIFYRLVVHREWDVAETSFAKYVSLVSQGDRSLTAIPVFPSRVFRHSSVYVRRDGPVRVPADLAGRRVGLPEWAQTAAIYSRGFLVDQFGLSLDDIEWVQAGVGQPGRVEKVRLALPPGIRLTPRPDASLDAMLLAGELDAVLSAHPPPSFKAGDPRVVRLFDDYESVERDYWRQTGVFPIMHTVTIRTDVLERYPFVAMSLYKGFDRAKAASLARLTEMTASRYPLPWLQSVARRAQAEFGEDPWPYGIGPNRTTLEAFLRYAHAQGVCHRLLTVEELFPATVQSAFKI